jgi:hypothetical protein
MHPRVFDVFACSFHITFPRLMTTHKHFTGAPSIGFLANFYPLNREKTQFSFAMMLSIKGRFFLSSSRPPTPNQEPIGLNKSGGFFCFNCF